ncbi:MAG: hypothetical protein LBV58_02255, partial [Acholeplasmatales bacterium]|nr:hypothetical protein [Acholeplasmatales bacterium]
VLDLHGKQTIEVDLQQRNYVKGTGIVWKNFTTNRFIKVDEAFAKEHYDFNHTKGSYNTSDSYHRCEIN